jgi:hypothetical protein
MVAGDARLLVALVGFASFVGAVVGAKAVSGGSVAGTKGFADGLMVEGDARQSVALVGFVSFVGAVVGANVVSGDAVAGTKGFADGLSFTDSDGGSARRDGCGRGCRLGK